MSYNLPPGMEEGDPHFYPDDRDCVCGCEAVDHEGGDGPCEICGWEACPRFQREDE